jgi:DNA/RNA-binding domain of Phe-tRNA-synthetase-like protein
MPVTLQYADTMRSEFPELATRFLHIEPIHPGADVSDAIARFHSIAASRLAISSEGGFSEIRAWRHAFAKMGLKQYRCASEALLRRFRKEGRLPRLHPLVDLCNAASVAYAIPIAVFDAARIEGTLEVRPATGEEIYETFSGEVERPEPGEIIFSDNSGRAHARRWTNRQSGYSAVRADTTAAFLVAEALHPTAIEDLTNLMAELKSVVLAAWPASKVAVA